MPLIVSETKSDRDPSQTYLTQALLSPFAEDDHDDGDGRPITIETSFSSCGAQARASNQPANISAGPAIMRDIRTEHFSTSPSENIHIPPANVIDSAMKSLGWLTCPVTTCVEDTELPAISVYSDPEVTEELELVIHSNGEGTAQTTGQRRVCLRSQGTNKPSVATFEGIHIKRAGLYVLEVHAVRNPELSLVADHTTTIVPKYAIPASFGDTSLPEELGLAKVQMWGA